MLIECVPNVSEGRRPDLIADLADGIRAEPGVRLLDHSADPAHHRSVYTIAGHPDALEAAVLALATSAVANIDLRIHQGVHPRVGALDVVPFIPLAGATMGDCVELSRRVAFVIARELGVPVYLYEEAATSASRAALEDIRRGGFEGLAEKMASRAWTPDFGPARPHPTAGATVVGARHALIAFNVNLGTEHVDIARRIAARVRQSSGGLPFVKAMGVAIPQRGCVQVSMNLTRFEETPVQLAFDRVVEEARREGVEVLESELIGLIPEAALEGTSADRLRLRDFAPTQVLEHRLREAGLPI